MEYIHTRSLVQHFLHASDIGFSVGMVNSGGVSKRLTNWRRDGPHAVVALAQQCEKVPKSFCGVGLRGRNFARVFRGKQYCRLAALGPVAERSRSRETRVRVRDKSAAPMCLCVCVCLQSCAHNLQTKRQNCQVRCKQNARARSLNARLDIETCV